MDTSILQLFAAEEIFERLAQKKATGCFKIFSAQESALVFFKKGTIVAAAKGEAEGESALTQILQWKDAVFVWEPDLVAPVPPLKPVLIKVDVFLGKQKTSTRPTVTGIATLPNGKAATPIQPGDGASSRAATKSITATAETRSANDEMLLRKYRLTLVSVANPAQKFKLGQANSLIGRNPGCDITIPDPSVSRQHCLLQLTERGLHAKDLNTVNGTKINGIVMKEGYINIGDKLTVGHLAYVLEGEKD